MNILVISDTHGNVQRAFTACANSEPVDIIIHLGDGHADADVLRCAMGVPVINVAGNCDTGSIAPRELVWECEGRRILLTHGDAYQVKTGLDKLRRRGVEVAADAVLFGHTHQGMLEDCSGMLLVNPGSLANHSHPRRYALLVITYENMFANHFDIE
ncbi:MAG: metallophosphoesterase [Desulfuromonadaceae bacterium]|nr:metallophosphoesterase [Desulfuromonadaceae bacterium]MDD5105885.1 metallophosphoesterase [Desulfuromonadaceae bacterium]